MQQKLFSHCVYLGLGGDQGDVLATIKKALNLLSAHSQITQVRCSHFYSTAPIEMESLEWFVNAVCELHTDLDPEKFFDIIQQIEQQCGKIAKLKNASRPIDIDLLFYDSLSYQSEKIQIPHPKWKERLFVLQPLSDLIAFVKIKEKNNEVVYDLRKIISSLLHSEPQAISLLEENPHIQ